MSLGIDVGGTSTDVSVVLDAESVVSRTAEPAFSDTNVVLGYVSPTLPDGTIELDVEGGRQTLKALGARIGLAAAVACALADRIANCCEYEPLT